MLQRRFAARRSALVAVAGAFAAAILFTVLADTGVLTLPAGITKFEAATLVFELCVLGWGSLNGFVQPAVRMLAWLAIALVLITLLVSGADDKLGLLGLEGARIGLHAAALVLVAQVLLSVRRELRRLRPLIGRL